MKILLADDMDIVREGIACEIKKVIPDAEIDDFSDGKYACSRACRADTFLCTGNPHPFYDGRISAPHTGDGHSNGALYL